MGGGAAARLAGTDGVGKTTYLGNLQGRHSDRGPGGTLPIGARVPDNADKSGTAAYFCSHLRTCPPVCSRAPWPPRRPHRARRPAHLQQSSRGRHRDFSSGPRSRPRSHRSPAARAPHAQCCPKRRPLGSGGGDVLLKSFFGGQGAAVSRKVSCVLLEAMPQTRLHRAWTLTGSKTT